MKKYFTIALSEAKKAYKKNEVPVGAIIVQNNKIISKSHNNRQLKKTVIGHAEINCIIKAEKKNRDWRLDDCTMYVTLEPCEMCKCVINEARIKNTYFLLSQDKSKQIYKKFTQTKDCEALKEEYHELLDSFFRNLRN